MQQGVNALKLFRFTGLSEPPVTNVTEMAFVCPLKPTCFILTGKQCKTVHAYRSSQLVLALGSMELPSQRVVLCHASAPTVSFFPAWQILPSLSYVTCFFSESSLCANEVY